MKNDEIERKLIFIMIFEHSLNDDLHKLKYSLIIINIFFLLLHFFAN